jgi:ubiquinone/menaquinone biosynthesis C-methylase UbiE
LFFNHLPRLFFCHPPLFMSNPATGIPESLADATPLTGFDRVAWCYDLLTRLVFGKALQKAQRAALNGLPAGAPHVLILGGGTGWVLTEVLRRRPYATVLYLEASPNMLVRAQQRLARESPHAVPQVEFRHGTQAALGPTERFDALVTFFVLDCIAAVEIGAALVKLRASRRPGAPWLLADFRLARSGWRRVLLSLMYRFFRLTTGLQADSLTDFRHALSDLGLAPISTSTFFAGTVEAVVFSENRN